ncbi:carboxypeptidase-like regulatory domain-containing protein [Niabella sp. W65]|nr:carboxypeptidase-like regulatory domain-containing protein [Niabella sp. W65]MCH7368175.1 carboxypeptidase-like regulatory domain-containing protein [Niabella sp. W65]
MRILLTALLIAFMPFLIQAQKDTTRSGTITGIVKDSADDYALQSVTITLYKKSDSSLVNYHITGEDGAFTFNDIPFFTPVNINFSFTGYNPFSKTITLDTANRSFNFKMYYWPRARVPWMKWWLKPWCR